MELINCKAIADEIKDRTATRVFDLCANSQSGHDLYRRPNLAILLVGNRPDSELYVRIKDREAKAVGIDMNLYRLEENTSDQEILDTVKFLNQDDDIDGILIQLPLPSQIDTHKIVSSMDPNKDVDGFHHDNLKKLIKPGELNKIVPPTFGAITSVLEYCETKLIGKNIVIIGNSDIFTKNLDTWLASFGANVKLFKANDEWPKETLQADIVICAVGRPGLLSSSMVQNEAIIIDVGINQVEGKTVGDCDLDSFNGTDCRITPVPGGIGPLTVALALQNTLVFFEKKISKH